MEQYDLIVIGAGWAGLPVAKTYLEVHPNGKLLVLDANQTVGGTWAYERLYEGLVTNNMVGMLEWSDFPMDFDTFGVKGGEHVPGPVLHKYLTAYAEHFGIFERIRFGCWVESAELLEDESWIVTYAGKEGKVRVGAQKLVLATGTTSQAHMPKFEGDEKFGGPLFHSKELSVREKEMEKAENVVVLGGSKSAADAVYFNAVKGRHVDWIIRASGKGPAWLCWPSMGFLGPVFDPDNYPGIRWFFHDTRLGRALCRAYSSMEQSDLIKAGKYNDHPESKKLIPPANIFWSGTSAALFNYQVDFMSLIQKGLISVHREDINRLSDHTVHLANRRDLKTDVFVSATGYKHKAAVKFMPETISNKIGFSTAGPTDPTVKAADAEIFKRYPELKDQPKVGPVGEQEREQMSCLLWHGVIPPAFIFSRNLAYSGMNTSFRGMLVFEIQALWTVAFLDGKLSTKVPGKEEAEWQAMLQNRFYRWRAPNGLGAKGTNMVFEIMPFLDTLMRELGLNWKRKGGWRELFEWYGVGDYKGLVKE